jgi:hypothetical protein
MSSNTSITEEGTKSERSLLIFLLELDMTFWSLMLSQNESRHIYSKAVIMRQCYHSMRIGLIILTIIQIVVPI